MWTAWRRWRVPCAVCPAVPAALVLACGILAAASRLDPGAGGWAAVAWTGAGLLIAVGTAPWRLWRLAALPLGAGLAALHLAAPWDRLEDRLPRPACRAAVQGIVRDPQCPVDALDILPDVTAAQIRIEAVRWPGSQAWQPVSARAMVWLPPGATVSYGERVMADGCFLAAPPPAFPGAFDYRAHLRQLGVRHVFAAQYIESQGVAGGLSGRLRCLMAIRDGIGSRLISRLASETHARIMLAMAFGFRQAMTPDLRDAFLRSGTIHVFSVSGLHVSIVAGVFLTGLCLIRVPYRWRCGLLPGLLGFYVVMTGAAPSAVRAWLMLSILFWARARFVALSPINGVAVAALAILLRHPLALFQPGFQYSFATVAALLLGWRAIAGLIQTLTERERWLPRSRRSSVRPWFLRLTVQALGASGLAWCGGAGLMLALSGLVVPAALPVNAVLVGLANLLLLGALPKALVACLPAAWPDALMAKAMDGVLVLIRGLAELGSLPGASGSRPVPPAGLALAYYLLFFAALSGLASGRWRARTAGGAAVCLGLMLWAPWSTPRLALVWGADCDVPVLIVERADGLPPVLLHPGTRAAWQVAADWLQHRGHRRVDALLVAWDTRRASAAAEPAVSLLRLDTLVLPGAPRPLGSLGLADLQQASRGGRRRRLSSADAAGVRTCVWPAGRLEVFPQGEARRIRLTLSSPASCQVVELRRDPSGRLHLHLGGERTSASGGVLTVIPQVHRRVFVIPAMPGADQAAAPGTRGCMPPRQALGG